jgi:mRNA deadenylase 3'-5' endonuclease subunit Ccr4
MMGVPVTFLDKYNPDQFEILGYEKSYHLQTRKYEAQVQVDKSGKKNKVTKLNDGVAIRVDRPPTDKTYYVVDGEYYIQRYKRIFIYHRRTRPAMGTTK